MLGASILQLVREPENWNSVDLLVSAALLIIQQLNARMRKIIGTL